MYRVQFARAILPQAASSAIRPARLAEDRVVLSGVSVQPAVNWWHWALSGAWVVIVAASVAWPWLSPPP
ncbi:MAG: hypothetical protein ACK2US_09035 [Anaerolineae bacterium]